MVDEALRGQEGVGHFKGLPFRSSGNSMCCVPNVVKETSSLCAFIRTEALKFRGTNP